MICFFPARRVCTSMFLLLFTQSEQDLEKQKNPSVYHLAAMSVTLKLLTNVINLRGTSANCVTGNVGKTNIRRWEEFSKTGKIRGKMLFNKNNEPLVETETRCCYGSGGRVSPGFCRCSARLQSDAIRGAEVLCRTKHLLAAGKKLHPDRSEHGTLQKLDFLFGSWCLDTKLRTDVLVCSELIILV